MTSLFREASLHSIAVQLGRVTDEDFDSKITGGDILLVLVVRPAPNEYTYPLFAPRFPSKQGPQPARPGPHFSTHRPITFLSPPPFLPLKGQAGSVVQAL